MFYEEILKNDLVEFIEAEELRKHNRIYITVPAEKITEVVDIIFNQHKARFAIATGVDRRDSIEILYHFCFDAQNLILTDKTFANKPFPVINSITPLVAGANWIEREIHDLLGVEFKNHPRLQPLILADDWPEGVYPLRKEYEMP